VSTTFRAPAESVATILRWVTQAVIDRGAGNRLAMPVIGLLVDRIREIKQRFARLAARLAAGTYVPRRCKPGRKAAAPRTRRPSELPRPREPAPPAASGPPRPA
jgi:hypothetical protein